MKNSTVDSKKFIIEASIAVDSNYCIMHCIDKINVHITWSVDCCLLHNYCRKGCGKWGKFTKYFF